MKQLETYITPELEIMNFTDVLSASGVESGAGYSPNQTETTIDIG